jgi:hypothetical protein
MSETNGPYPLGFTTLEREADRLPLGVEGDLPAWLIGSLIRTGPGNSRLVGKPIRIGPTGSPCSMPSTLAMARSAIPTASSTRITR